MMSNKVRSCDLVSYPLKVSLVIIILILLCSCATPRPWTKGEKIAAGVFVAGHVADAYTTTQLVDNGHYEKNPILGKYPSDGKVTVYFSITGAIVLILSHFYPDLRKPVLFGCGGLGFGLAIHNRNLD